MTLSIEKDQKEQMPMLARSDVQHYDPIKYYIVATVIENTGTVWSLSDMKSKSYSKKRKGVSCFITFIARIS